MRKNLLFAIFFLALFAAHAQDARAGAVVASIKPLHSLVAAVMTGDDNAPILLADGKNSLHSFSLKPSQMQALSHADVVFYMGDGFELFLNKILEEAPGITRVPMQKANGIVLYPLRRGAGFQAHTHEEEGYHHDVEPLPAQDTGYDLHLWTSPANAKLMIAEIANKLSLLYPSKKNLYQANAARLSTRLDMLDANLRVRMLRLSGKPFVVFHDAYQYFEKEYTLTNVGSIMLHPEYGLSAKRMRDIRGKIKNTGAKCVLTEAHIPETSCNICTSIIPDTRCLITSCDAIACLIPYCCDICSCRNCCKEIGRAHV